MKTKCKFVLASVLSALTLGAQAEVSGYVTLASDYVFRGVTLNDKGPALQAGLDWEGETGWYSGAWASQTDDGESTDVEVNLFGGYAGEIDGGISFDFMVIYYALLDASDFNYIELHGGFSKGVSDKLSFGLNFDYANDSLAAAGFGDEFYALQTSVVAEYAVTDDMALSLEYGHQKWDQDGENAGYNWGRISLSKDYNDFSFDLSVWHNDLEDDDSSKFTASASYNF